MIQFCAGIISAVPYYLFLIAITFVVNFVYNVFTGGNI